MKQDYSDILQAAKGVSPKWWTQDGVPRFCDPDPDRLSGGGKQVFLLQVKCQSCGHAYVVEHVVGYEEPEIDDTEQLEWAYGDPPLAEDPCCSTGYSMNTYTAVVLRAYERRTIGGRLTPRHDLEGPLSTCHDEYAT
jgi:hypothetical protein